MAPNSPGSNAYPATPQPLIEIAKITGISGNELTRYLKSITNRFNLLDRSQHACQKIQSSWKVGFLEIQCRRSISEIFDLITQERDLLHQKLYQLTIEGVSECVSSLQRATLVFEDRPQLIEFFCEQMKQVRALKDGERQLHQNIRNVDEAARALKRYAPALATEFSLQYNIIHSLFSKYSSIVQSHAKFVTKMLPLITQQVSSALSKYATRVQRLSRMYEDFASISTEDELERHVGSFQDIMRELRTIEDALKLYQEYQKMVGLKLVEIPMLAETITKWEEVQQIVTLAVQWRATVNLMENGVFSEQNWKVHTKKLEAFLPQIQELQQRKELEFAARLVQNLRTSIASYLQKLALVGELAHSYIKGHHWHQILVLLDAVSFVSNNGVLATDGSSLTLGFLGSRNLWAFESQIRQIARKAQNDSVAEEKLEEMKKRLLQAVLPLLRTGDYYEIDTATAVQLLGSFEDDLLTIQALGQIITSDQLHASLVKWAEEISCYQEVLDLWISAQHDWTRLTLLFCLYDVQQSVSEAAFDFQSLDRKWKAMMNAARSASSLTVCLREVINIAFLKSSRLTFEKLWEQLSSYLREKRRFFPRFNFLSDGDLLELIASARYPDRLSKLISKCFRDIRSLRIASVEVVSGKRTKSETELLTSDLGLRSSVFSVTEAHEESDDHTSATPGHPLAAQVVSLPDLCQIEEVNGAVTAGESLLIKPLHISSSPEIWMKDLWSRIKQAMQDLVSATMNGSDLVNAFDGNFEELVKYHSQSQKRRRSSSIRRSSAAGAAVQSGLPVPSVPERTFVKDTPHRRFWEGLPVQVVLLCMNILLTNELTLLVNLDRNGASWKHFWTSLYIKKVSLVDFIRRRDCTCQDRVVVTTLLTWLINKSHEIQELYDSHPVSVVLDSDNAEATSTHRYYDGDDTSLSRYNYSTSDSFAWIKMMRFYYEPFENKCVVHHSVKTFDYGFAYLGGYRCPVLTPLCDRVLLKMSTALSLEMGCLLHSTSSSSHSGKRTMVNELAATVGVECIDYDCGLLVGFDQFQRMIHGVLQSDACWLVVSSLEIRESNNNTSFNLVRAIANEMNRLKDAIHARQETFPFDGELVDISNPRLGIMIAARLDFSKPTHQELMLQFSYAFVPVGCVSPELELIWETMLHASGLKHWKALSKKLVRLCLVIDNDPKPFTDVPMRSLRLVLAVAKNIVKQFATNCLKNEEKCVLVALWDEVRSKILPERRIAFLKHVREVFPLALQLEYTSFGTLTTRVDLSESAKLNPDEGENVSPRVRSSDAGFQTSLGFDSDEEKQKNEFISVKDRLLACLEAKHLVPSETILRKLLELYHIVNRSVATIVVGAGILRKLVGKTGKMAS
uniref:Dynein heavy chain linker domain-containing protein n=1 Tax=Globisporangium ultimum (strain ATCC 200006 / CBS 805.95 / DAOM BR144) TaxID=431595 RepID=K3WPD2_GLOUD